MRTSFVLSSGPEPIGYTTIQYINDSDFVNSPGPARTEVPLPTEDLNEDLGASNSDDNSLPFLCDPEPEFFCETSLPSISLIGAAAFK